MKTECLLIDINRNRNFQGNKPLLVAIDFFDCLIETIKENLGEDIELDVLSEENGIFAVLEALNIFQRIRGREPNVVGTANKQGYEVLRYARDSIGESVYILKKQDAKLLLKLLARTKE